MTSVEQQIIDVDLDPEGYAPRADLYVRNLSAFTITFNLGSQMRWELPPWPDPNHEGPLPWTVARSSGFERLWGRGQVLVALAEDFASDHILTELPATGLQSRPTVFRQLVPQSVVDITHDIIRDGPVMLSVFSLDGQTEYFNFRTEMLSQKICRVSFDDPISFMATVF